MEIEKIEDLDLIVCGETIQQLIFELEKTDNDKISYLINEFKKIDKTIMVELVCRTTERIRKIEKDLLSDDNDE